MFRASLLLCVFIFLASTLPGICQGVPGCYPGIGYPSKSFQPRHRVAPIVRTVRVDVPAPCVPPPCCMPITKCAPGFCGPPPCRPPCPTRPVRVRVEVVVKPEGRKPCVPKRYCCENPPIFEPFFQRAACMLGSMVLAPLGLGQSILGHGLPRVSCPPPTPIACPPCRVGPCTGVGNGCRPPLPGYMNPCRPVAPVPLSPTVLCSASGSRALSREISSQVKSVRAVQIARAFRQRFHELRLCLLVGCKCAHEEYSS